MSVSIEVGPWEPHTENGSCCGCDTGEHLSDTHTVPHLVVEVQFVAKVGGVTRFLSNTRLCRKALLTLEASMNTATRFTIPDRLNHNP
jgi:hypothetical protein